MRNPGGKQFPQEHCVCFRKGKAESKICRETSAEARPFQGRATALESEGIALFVGPRGRSKTGGGPAAFSSRLLKKSLST